MKPAEILLTCPRCKLHGFTVRGIHAHHCRANGRKKLSVPAIQNAIKAAGIIKAPRRMPSPVSPSPMSKPETTTALSLISSPELVSKNKELPRLQAAVIGQLLLMQDLRREEGARGVLVGLKMHRVKVSMPHGTFGPWIQANVKGVSVRYVQYMMKLALVFIEKAKLTRAELLVLSGEVDQLDPAKAEGHLRRGLEKVGKFVDEHSLTELLIKHNIKAVGLKTELADSKAADDAGLSPEQKMEQARAEAWEQSYTAVQRIRSALTDADQLQLLNDPKQVETLKAELVEINRLADERLAALRAIAV